MRARPDQRHGRGFSLIEAVLALALSSMVIALLMQGLSAVRHSTLLIDQLSQVQEQGLLASALLAEAITASTASVLCAGQPSWRLHWLDQATSGASARPRHWPVQPPTAALNVNARAESDVLVLRQPHRHPPVSITSAAIDEPVLSTDGHEVRDCEVVLISDCTHSELFQNQSSSAHQLARGTGSCAPGNRNLPWRQAWAGPVQLLRFEWAAWYIRAETDGELALYRTTWARDNRRSTAAEVRGIERLKVEYGVSEDGGRVTAWLTAAAVNDWRRVVAVRVAVVSRSQAVHGRATGADGERAALSVWGQIVEVPDDGRVRRVFTRTVAFNEHGQGAG